MCTFTLSSHPLLRSAFFILVTLLATIMANGQSMDGGDGNARGGTFYDSLLIGKWRIIESINLDGDRTGDSFEIEYRSDGKALFNRKALYKKFNQRIVRAGNPAFSNADLDRYFPRVTWKTDQNRIILTFKSRLGIDDLTYHYQIRGDTLTTVHEVLAGTRSKLVAVRRVGAE